MDCNICCESINKSVRKPITCPYCEFLCCLRCFKRFLLESAGNSSCMMCKRELSLDFITRNTPKTFHNIEYRAHRTQILYERERSLLPTTQHLAEEELEKRRIQKENKFLYDEDEYLRFRRTEIIQEINNKYGTGSFQTIMKAKNRNKFTDTADFVNEMMYIGRRRREIKNITQPIQQTPFLQSFAKREEEKDRKKFIKACPNGECRGFLSSVWKCGTCKTYVCKDCHEVKKNREDDTHICDPDFVATAKLLKSETKPCPKCAVPIYKIDGCDQMWCVECRTPFSWNTGQIVNDIVHNPHFYEWQRQQNNGNAPRVLGDEQYNRCGELPWIQDVEYLLKLRKINLDYWQNCFQIVEHTRRDVLIQYPEQTDIIQDNSDLRVKYLINDIDEKQWKKTLQMRQKRREKNHEINQILQMFVTTLTDIWNRFIVENIDIVLETEELRKYVNDNLQVISKQFNNKVPKITNSWLMR